jgi:hypothetical protein
MVVKLHEICNIQIFLQLLVNHESVLHYDIGIHALMKNAYYCEIVTEISWA